MQSGSMLYMTEEEVRLAIQHWWNDVHNKQAFQKQRLESVKAMPTSDQFCLSVQFGELK